MAVWQSCLLCEAAKSYRILSFCICLLLRRHEGDFGQLFSEFAWLCVLLALISHYSSAVSAGTAEFIFTGPSVSDSSVTCKWNWLNAESVWVRHPLLDGLCTACVLNPPIIIYMSEMMHSVIISVMHPPFVSRCLHYINIFVPDAHVARDRNSQET